MKRGQVVREGRRGTPKSKLKAAALRNAALHLPSTRLDEREAPEFWSMRDVAHHLRYTGKNAALQFVEKRGLRKHWRGRAWLVRRVDVLAVLDGHDATVKERK